MARTAWFGEGERTAQNVHVRAVQIGRCSPRAAGPASNAPYHLAELHQLSGLSQAPNRFSGQSWEWSITPLVAVISPARTTLVPNTAAPSLRKLRLNVTGTANDFAEPARSCLQFITVFRRIVDGVGTIIPNHLQLLAALERSHVLSAITATPPSAWNAHGGSNGGIATV
jgi:hypothetical protein